MLSANATTILWDESSPQGDISDLHLSPTTLQLQLGKNQIIGSLAGGSIDSDLFTIVVPSGFSVTEFRVIAFSGGRNGSFLGVTPGSTLASSPSAYRRSEFDLTVRVNPINFLLINENLVGDEGLLRVLTNGAPLSGASTLEAGSYAFWANETANASTYTIEFEVAPVPEPSSVFFGLVGSALLLRRRR